MQHAIVQPITAFSIMASQPALDTLRYGPTICWPFHTRLPKPRHCWRSQLRTGLTNSVRVVRAGSRARNSAGRAPMGVGGVSRRSGREAGTTGTVRRVDNLISDAYQRLPVAGVHGRRGRIYIIALFL